MSVVLQFSKSEEAKALPLLLRHSPGTVLANRTYVVDETAIGILREAGIGFCEIAPAMTLPSAEGMPIGERV